ncbi:alpha/beta fold hydrolase [Winogradskyella aurantia]|uniref:Alpha/beta hydrolase n=1 Tax=Winogradskyella aurantia TaxID=1915063 RepID=A0A265UQD0_9FLAO|nr:alpha/beta fold hydrolase [Winogradskyella aurantia]OZV67499.1 alpha/beta hydrolase [Winogradskyella aurantia]
MRISYLLLFLLSTPFSVFSQSSVLSEDILLMNDSIQLPGTLTYKADKKEQPLAIFIQGSGNPDRNGNQLALGIKANYIKSLRDSLNQNGIAFYSFDKRNVTPSNIKFLTQHFIFEDLVDDVETIINHFGNDKRFNSITLIGHSQGSLVGMLAISEHIDGFVSVSGLGESADKTIVKQVTAQSEVLGNTTREHFSELKATGSIKEVNPMLISLFAKQNHEFLISYINYIPSEEIKKIKIPILILNGTKDLQVKTSEAELLHKANPESKLVLIENMNHVLKTIDNDEDNLKSYSSSEFPLSKHLVAEITEFIKSK